MKVNGKLSINNIGIEIFLLIVALIWIVPAITAIKTSLQVDGIQNYIHVLTAKIDDINILPRMFLNSVIISGVSIAIIILASVPTAFAFSKLHFRGRVVLYVAILGCFAIPIISTLIPNSILITRLGLRNTHASMIILMVTANLPLSIMILKGNIDSISNTYMEAARIDGSSNFNTLLKIIVPMSMPAIVNVLVVLFIQVWNEFQIPLIFAGKPILYPLTLAPSFFGISQNRLDLPPLYASIILIAVPVVVFYIFMQDKIIKGMTLGGIKE
jgi:raffinose/stachyose/melibiose transport system permease protein